MNSTFSSTVYGALRLINQLNNLSDSFKITDIKALIKKILSSILNIFVENTSKENESSSKFEVECLETILKEIIQIFDKHPRVMNHIVDDLLEEIHSCNYTVKFYFKIF